MKTFQTTRRSFLIGGIQVVGCASLAPSVLARAAHMRAAGDERVLVVIQMSGGNDGLNTVVPFRQDEYYRGRPAISLAKSRLHRLDDDHGLHPSMGKLAEHFDAGELAVLHGVGYPEPDRSHFRSMQIWHTADPKTSYGAGAVRPTSGWLGRLSAQLAGTAAMPALFIGSGDLPLSLATESGFTPSVRDARGFRLEVPVPGFEEHRAELLDAGTKHGANLDLLRRAAKSTYDAAARMQALDRDAGANDYPGSDLAKQLALTARLIAGGFGTRVFGLELGSFDTHAMQVTNQAALLGELSDALAAFGRDLAKKGVADRVVTLVFSEFGRRVSENASRGTDHGAGAPAFVFGTPVRGGLYGTPPNLTNLDEGDIPYTTDFRSIYTGLEHSWLGLEPSTDLRPVPGLL
jgi:uncharacterized protein (DUF1501 family)